MDDLRFEWLRKQIYLALEIKDDSIFDEFLSQGSNEYELNQFLAKPAAVGAKVGDGSGTDDAVKSSTAFFYKNTVVEEVEEEIEVPTSEYYGDNWGLLTL